MRFRISLSGESPDPLPIQGLDGVGLIRPEFIARHLGVYPTHPDYRSRIVEYLKAVNDRFPESISWYRLCDLWSDEANPLAGNTMRMAEANPLVGQRGIRRVLSDASLLSAETSILSEVDPLMTGVVLPFVSTAQEFAVAASILRDAGWKGRVGTMIETPAAALDAEAFIEAGADYLLIGLNDLTALTMAKERGNEADKLHETVWSLIRSVGDAARERGSVWGLAGSMTKRILSKAAENGIPFVTIHYSETADLLGAEFANLPELDFVQSVKRLTNSRKEQKSKYTVIQ